MAKAATRYAAFISYRHKPRADWVGCGFMTWS